jgi:pimeloyl-ACP methyl ester carboxylesterase
MREKAGNASPLRRHKLEDKDMNIGHTKHGDIEYRLEERKSKTVLLLPGSHMSARVRVGEDYFLERDHSVLVVSRPGYGKTPLSTGPRPSDFADALRDLLEKLAIKRVVLVGISGGGRTALSMAATYPERVEKLILQSSLSFAPWPDLKTRLAAYFAFNPVTETYSWRTLRRFLRKNPKAAVKMMLSNMTTLEPEHVVRACNEQHLQSLIELFNQLGSGSGFMADIRASEGDATGVKVPTLIVHSKHDKSVPLSHPHILAQQIPHAHLYLSDAESHLFWFSSHYIEIKKAMDEFLESK